MSAKTAQQRLHIDATLADLEAMRVAVEDGRYVACFETRPTQGAACWNWLNDFTSLIYTLVKSHKGGPLRNLRIVATWDTGAER